MTRPRILISGTIRRFEGADRASVNAAYARSVGRVGGIPVIVPPVIDPADAPAAMEGVDGLVLTGGDDVDPTWYHQSPSQALGAVDRARDEFDLALLRVGRERGLPILGICRGLQVVNVALGGTLWQDLPSERPSQVIHEQPHGRDARTHDVHIEPSSRLARAIGITTLHTNSFHHQAIRDLAPGLKVTAWADDGVIEGIEAEDLGNWLLAVQWHPEEFHQDPSAPDQRLFEALVGTCYAAK